MPRYDAHHEIVKRALERDGWTITKDPLIIEYEDLRLFADLGAEKTFAAEKAGRKIAVEIKVFGAVSFIDEFHKAAGQYGNYRALLRRVEPDRVIFLAVPLDVYETEFLRASIRDLVADLQIKLVVYDPLKEEIVLWSN